MARWHWDFFEGTDCHWGWPIYLAVLRAAFWDSLACGPHWPLALPCGRSLLRVIARFAFTLEAPGALLESGKSSRPHSVNLRAEYRCLEPGYHSRYRVQLRTDISVCVCVCVCSEDGKRFYLRQNHPDRLWVPLNLPLVWYRVISRQ
jgi:hypothetical protein